MSPSAPTLGALPDFGAARVLVAGDVMLDRYWQGPTSRISPEAPVPVVRIERDETRAGGAANVALNIAALGGNAVLLGVVGRDEAAVKLRAEADRHGVEPLFVDAGERPTITKLRILSRNQQLIRLDFEESLSQIGAFDREDFVAHFEAALARIDVVILSDYGKGTLVDVERLIALARGAGRPVLIDPKGSNWEPYRGATLITPNLAELEAVVGPCPDEATIVAKGMALIGGLELAGLLVTRSEQGMTLLLKDTPPLHLPAEAREVYDVTGAGDTVIATLAAGLAAGQDLAHAARIANVAAGIVIGKLGTATVSTDELARAIRHQHDDDSGVLDEAELIARVAEARARKQIVVMTNGCFDLLHVGHVRYLEAARKLGDVLVVAVNTDESVRVLKGPTRPLNATADRMRMLAALKSVDWVVPFAEQTPQRLIEAVLPDLLVKGGDYTPEQVAGGEAVTQNGGQVVILSFHDGYSTTKIIERART